MIGKTETLKGNNSSGLNERVIRETMSVCPVCLAPLPAVIRAEADGVYLDKTCLRHGPFRALVSAHPEDYQTLSDCYFYFIPGALEQREYYVCASTRCNISCPICYLHYCPPRSPLTAADLNTAVRDKPQVERFTFSHGEPTVSPQLPEMIRALKKAGKFVNIHTNGVKLADYDYTQSLKQAGLDHVSLQVDGFHDEIYETLRGGHFLEAKMRALHNLKVLGIPVTLNVTIARGVNEKEWDEIFDYVVRNDFIKDVSYITYCHYPPQEDAAGRAMMPDDLVIHLVEHSQGTIAREDVVCFQKLFYAYLSAFRKKKCFNYYHYCVVRTAGGYRGIEHYLDIRKIAGKIDACRERQQTMTKKLLLKILLTSLKWNSVALIPYGVFLLLRGGYPQKPGKLLVVTLASICDPYKYDATVALNCGQGIITQAMQHESYGAYIIDEMKRFQSPSAAGTPPGASRGGDRA
ncbi:MAG TPA: radical SAM protein [Candidatus Omnitrophota bacterium]|nr:radical SAM protein [Candidatus Omnitrophota bacterium]